MYIGTQIMSFQAMTWAVKQKVPAMQKIVLLMLANRNNYETNECFPSIKTLSIECGMSQRSVINQLEKLVYKNLISVIRTTTDGVKKVNHYKLCFSEFNSAGDALWGGSARDSLLNSLASKEDHSKINSAGDSVGSAGDALGGSAGDAHEPVSSFNQSINLKDNAHEKKQIAKHQITKKPSATKTPEIRLTKSQSLLIDFGITGSLAKDFIEHRKGRKAAITETALNGFQREADKAGISIVDAVRISIEKNWAGFNSTWNWRDDDNKQYNGQKVKTGWGTNNDISPEHVSSMDCFAGLI
jgi:hypothetical protein